METQPLSVAIPALDELDALPHTLDDLVRQSYRNFKVFVCVNQPDAWWDDGCADHLEVCRHNAMLLEMLDDYRSQLDLTVLDCSSPSKGWQGKRQGVGWARKQLFDSILEMDCTGESLLVSLDADTRVDAGYLGRLVRTFECDKTLSALAVPYYHRLLGEEKSDRLLLRYECYMRHYLLQMLRIENPYAFTAIGSAMAFTARAYRRVGGITPLQGGEDFYLMQKFAKTGRVGLRLMADDGGSDDTVAVFPSGRTSRRVPFGTGPAVSMCLAQQAAHYPFFSPAGFDAVAETYDLFPALYEQDVATPMTVFLQRQLSTDDIWGPLRRNHTTRQRFVHACAERIDGLRILQYLRSRPDGVMADTVVADFENASVPELDAVRNGLFRKEMSLRQQ